MLDPFGPEWEAGTMGYVDDDDIRKYFETYIEAYGVAVKAAGKPGQEPDFYKAMPYKVDVFRMPNETIVAIMYGKAPKPLYTVYEGEYDTVAGYLKAKAHQHCIMFYPTKNFSTDDAKADAKAAVGKDTRSSIYRAGLMAARNHIEGIGSELGEIAKANPWLEKQLKDLETKLLKAKTPLDKLWDEYKKLDESESFSVQQMTLNELRSVEKDATGVPEFKVVEAFISRYIKVYLAAIKPEYPDHAKPPFFKGAPHKVRATIMPNNSVAVLAKYNAVVESIEVAEGNYDAVKALIDNKEYNFFLHYPPLKALTDTRASNEAKLAVKSDIRNTLHLALLRSTGKVISDHQEKIKEIMKTNPWLEGPLSSISKRLAGVAKLLQVLTNEIENNQLNTKATEQKRRLQEVSRFRKPKRTVAAPEEVPVPPIAAMEVEPVITKGQAVEAPQMEPASGGPLFIPSTPPSAIAGENIEEDGTLQTYEMYSQRKAQQPQVQQRTEAPPVVAGMSENEKALLNEIRAEVFEFRKKVDEFDRKVSYMDNYIETQVQKRQDEKFKEMEALQSSQIRKSSGIATGLGIAAMIISLLVFVTNISSILAFFGI